MKRQSIRIIEIHVHRSKKNKRLGHAVAILFPCNHHKYLGITLFRGESDIDTYRTQDARVIRFEDYSVTDKEVCKLCPHDDYWLDSLSEDIKLDDLADILEEVDDF
jgi:hypothetical protein